MHKKSKKIAAAFLGAALLMSNSLGCVPGGRNSIFSARAQEQAETMTETPARETQVQTLNEEMPTEKVTEAPTEKVTEAPTEKVTETPTEKVTEAPTEKVTEAPTEKATEAPTEKATEAPTEKATEAPTEKVTEAPTEKVTEAPTEKATEALTETATENKNSETLPEDETGRKNSGTKMKADDLAAALKEAQPYLFAAETVTVPETLLQFLSAGQADEETGLLEEESLIADGEAGAVIAEGLESFSVKLANARSSSDVEVLNLYADKDGKLDTAQLKEKFKDSVIDVTKKYYVINVIAENPDQKLDFSGYQMTLSGQRVVYEEETQPGDILYNFAALDNEKLVGYEGSLTLNGELQGTFLAPEASVKVKTDLAGAVFAETVTVEDSVQKLLHIVFLDGKSAAAETAGEPVTENTSATETASETAAEEPAGTETASEAGTEEPAGTETASEAGTEEPAGTETASEAGTEEPAGTETASEAGTEESAGTETASETATEDLDESEAALEKALEEIRSDLADAETETVIDEQVIRNQAQTLYSASGEGTGAVNGTAAAQSQTETELMLESETEVKEIKASLKITITDGEGNAAEEAVFVVKDSSGRVLRDELSGTPLYVLNYTKAATFVLDGLTAGTYYLSQTRAADGYAAAEDLLFELKADGSIWADGHAIDADKGVELVNAPIKAASGNMLHVYAKTFYNDVLLTATEKKTIYAALFADKDLQNRVSAVKELTYEADDTQTDVITFYGLSYGSYYLAETDEYGEPAAQLQSSLAYEVSITGEDAVQAAPVVFVQDAQTAGGTLENGSSAVQTEAVPVEEPEEKTAVMNFLYKNHQYPSGVFSYLADVTVTKEVLDQDGKARSTEETFYMNLFWPAKEGQELGDAVFAEPFQIRMDGASVASATVQVEMTENAVTFAVRETDKAGNVILADTEDFAYAVIYKNSGKVKISCTSALDETTGEPNGLQEVTAVTVRNKLNDSVVRIRIEDQAASNLLSGVSFVIKDSNRSVIAVNGKVQFQSGNKETVWTNILTPGETYYLSEVNAPDGYTPALDVKFTVQLGAETLVVMQNAAAVSSDYKLTVSKLVYSGNNQVYAYDTTNGTYAAEGAYTFYVALFSDAARTKKVSNVQTVKVSALGGTTEFKNLKKGETYYVAETDQYGQMKRSSSELTIRYSNAGKVDMTATSRTAIIQNSYSTLPRGYRYTGTLTLTKKVVDATGAEKRVSGSFYIGIYRKSDYSDTPTVVKLDLQDASSASVKRRILLSGSEDMIYYIAEVDAQGKRITDSSDFSYSVQIDQPTVTISRGVNAQVTVTNKARSNKATLYLTKKVYDGTAQKAVTETFYAGLFKDPEFKNPYTKPIALTLNGKSEITLKLSLNLGSASSATIYIAEVDANGNVIRDQKNFGYQIRMVNSTAAFTQDRLEIQTILLNSVYGSASEKEWNQIISSAGNDIGSVGGGYWGVSDNGYASDAEDAVQTGDSTPILPYTVLMGAAFAVLAGGFLQRRKKIQ